MSSFKKAAPRRTHQERSQPLARQKLGLLEKHKDYVIRAKDFHIKENAIKKLKQKAAFRNPDEFYFAMINSKTQKGVHIKERSNHFDHDTLTLLKTQDQNYILYQRSINLKKIQKMQQGAQQGKNEHRIFVDDDEFTSFDPVKHFDTVPELVHVKSNRLRKADLEKMELQETVACLI